MDEREKSIARTSLVGILGNLLLVGGKAFVGIVTHSSSIISDAINNLSDALSSFITIVGTKLSSKRPNKKHPYGYGRIEYLTATLIAILILFAGGTAIYESIVSLVNQETPTYDTLAFILISVGILVKLSLGLFFRFRGKKLNSAALKNSATDALFDVLLSASTLACALISHFTQVYLEGYAGIAIGLFILRSGFIALKESLSPILGERVDDAFARELKASVCGHPYVLGAYDLIIHSYGESKKIGSIHVEIEDEVHAKDIYALEREIQTFCYEKYGIIMTVGIYASSNDPESMEIKDELSRLVKEEPLILQWHGFYLDKKRDVVSFDLLISHEAGERMEEIAKNIETKLEAIFPSWRYAINIDQDFSA